MVCGAEALAIMPGGSAELYNLALVLYRLGKSEVSIVKAIRYFESAIDKLHNLENSPESDLPALYLLASVYAELGARKCNAELIDKAITRYRELLYIQESKNDKRRRVLERSQKSTPHTHKAYDGRRKSSVDSDPLTPAQIAALAASATSGGSSQSTLSGLSVDKERDDVKFTPRVAERRPSLHASLVMPMNKRPPPSLRGLSQTAEIPALAIPVPLPALDTSGDSPSPSSPSPLAMAVRAASPLLGSSPGGAPSMLSADMEALIALNRPPQYQSEVTIRMGEAYYRMFKFTRTPFSSSSDVSLS